jgi:hypothetical protein
MSDEADPQVFRVWGDDAKGPREEVVDDGLEGPYPLLPHVDSEGLVSGQLRSQMDRAEAS